MSLWIRRGVILLVVVAIGWAVARAYRTSPKVTRSATPEWSKGIPLGETSVNNLVAATVGAEGNIFLAWPDMERQLHLAELDNYGRVVQNVALDLPTRWPGNVQLHSDAGGGFCLTWLDGEQGHLSLYAVQLDPVGKPRSRPISLTPGQVDVASYAITLNPQGNFDVFWAEERGGIYHRTYKPAGAMGVSSLLIAKGADLVARLDDLGYARLVWLRESAPSASRFEVYYATYDTATGQIDEEQPVGLIFKQTRQRRAGPFLGLDTRNAYIFWSLAGEGRGRLFYSTFPLDDPAAHREKEIRLPGTNFVRSWSVAEGQAADLVAAWTVELASRLRREHQVAEARFSDGELREMKVVTLSDTTSLRPAVLRDAQGDLHMVWLDPAGFAQYRIMYASTSPLVKNTLRGLNVRSLVDGTLNTLVYLSTIIFFIPLLLLWALAPLAFLVIYSVVTYRVELSNPATRWALIAAIVVQILATGLIVPGVPTINWEGLSPQTVALLLRWILPVFLAGVALGVMLLYLRRAEAKLLLQAFFVFSATHGVLRLAFYVATYVPQAFSFGYLHIRH